MLKVTAVPVKLGLKTPFHIAHGSSEYRENVFLQIMCDGHVSYGEAAVVPYYGVTKEHIIEDLKHTITAKMIRDNQILDVVDAFAYKMSACAYTSAMRGLQMQKAGTETEKVQKMYKRGSSFTIAYTPDIQSMLDSIAACGFSTIKLKAGFEDDIVRIRRIRERFPSLHIRLDANQGWTFAQACSIIEQVQDLSIELIEEPIVGTVEQLQTLSQMSDIPILLDETVQTEEDIKRYAGSATGIVVKLAKSGGPQAALQLVEEAKKLGLEILLSCMVESSLGIVNALALEPLCKWIDLDAPILLSEDVFSGLSYKDELPHGSLLKLQPSSRLLECFASTEPFIME